MKRKNKNGHIKTGRNFTVPDSLLHRPAPFRTGGVAFAESPHSATCEIRKPGLVCQALGSDSRDSQVQYISTRGEAPKIGFEDVLLAGLASDGGLYVPESWPQFTSDEIAAMAGRPYAETAFRVMSPFMGDFLTESEFSAMIKAAYASFHHPAVTPLVQSGDNEWVLELFRGPTLAFKDVAMQILGRVMDHALTRRGQKATVVCATSGDTGGAAIEAYRGREAADIFVLHPNGQVSEVQRRQMTTAKDANVHNIAIDGTFDDCQALLKAMFNTPALRSELSLAGVNSINWARIIAQVVYYFTAATALGAPHRAVSFTVPTGNFGDIFAGWVARQMGLPVERLRIATNVNDILHRALSTGRYEVGRVQPTASPSMDIQVSSNFERLLFELGGRDAGGLRRQMDGLAQSGAFEIPAGTLAAMRALFSSARVDEAETAATISAVHEECGLLIDPHTAVGVHAARQTLTQSAAPMVVLATAHPAKFPDAVEAATGQRPALPPHLADLLERKERFTVLPNDFETVSSFIGANARAAQ